MWKHIVAFFIKKRRETVVLKKDQCLMRVKQNAPNSAW